MFNNNFVLLKLITQEAKDKKALENSGADKLMADWGGAKSGLPFLVFLNNRGEKIADSNRAPGGKNIGCPATQEEVDAFSQILRETAPRITEAQRNKLRAYFLELNKKK
jgi:hypothetical protein